MSARFDSKSPAPAGTIDSASNGAATGTAASAGANASAIMYATPELVISSSAPACSPQGRKRVVVLATGGTIAGVGAAGKSVGYESGQLTVEDLLSEVPEIAQVADIEAYQVCNVNSDDMTASLWLELAREIEALSAREDVTGFVVTHGTDTMDETAYFLNLVLDTRKPVILTGSMRPATATSADGPMNLYQSVVAAAAPESVDKGVMVCFSGCLYNARTVQKTNTHSVTTMSGGESGSCAVIRDDEVFYSSRTTKAHTAGTAFHVGDFTELPRVSVLYFNVDADPRLVQAAAAISDGLVIAGAGAGEFSKLFAAQIAQVEIPVVVSSRVGTGVIMPASMLVPHCIAASDLPPQKAAILLRLALAHGASSEEIARMFRAY